MENGGFCIKFFFMRTQVVHVSPGVGFDLNTTAAQQLPQSLTGTQLKHAFETPVGREHANPPEVCQLEQN